MNEDDPNPGDRRRTLVIHALHGGGAERVAAATASHWAECGIAVTLITLDAASTDAYRLDPRVRRVGLGLMARSRWPGQGIARTIHRAMRLRKAIRAAGADQVISLTDRINVLTLLACRGGSWRVTIAERNDPRRQWMGAGWEWLRRRTYPSCEALVVQTRAVAEYAARLVRGRPVHVIPNFVAPPRLPDGPEREPVIVAMGRLDPQKGFDLLLEAFARAMPRHADWRLEILGEGPERPRLESLATRLDVTSRVTMPGWVADPVPRLAAGGLFALSSRYEGFPNALLEAMACGLPPVSFDCDSGPAEIIRHGIDGLLVPTGDALAFAAAMEKLMADPTQRAALGSRAREVLERFSEADFFRRWEQVLEPTAR